MVALAPGLVVLVRFPFSDLSSSKLTSGGLNRDSFVRPGKLFTASASIISREAGALLPVAHRTIINSVVALLQAGVP